MKQNKNFFILGITGGAGSGKTTVVECIQKIASVIFLHCDVIAHELMQPKGASYDALIKEFGTAILEENTQESLALISREKLAKIAMATKESRNRLNEITHPLVREAIEKKLELLQKEQFHGIVIIEAALLIEAGYKEICDELWYVHAPIEDRKRRMRQNRGYTEQKIEHILATVAISGAAVLFSYLETICGDIYSKSASSLCVILNSFLKSFMFFPIAS